MVDMTQNQPLSEMAIAQHIESLTSWKRNEQSIFREFQFKDFSKSIVFVNLVAEAAEKENHHPDIDIRWNKVKLALTSHDAGGLTLKDFHLAKKCNALAESSSGNP